MTYLNLVHPRSTPWNDIFKPAASRLQLDFIPYDKWVELLGSKDNVAVKGGHEASDELTEYLSSDQLGSGKFRMDVTLEKCPSLKGVKALEGADLMKSLDFWKM